MSQTVLGASVAVLVDDGQKSFILDRDTVAGSPVTPVRTYLGSDTLAGGVGSTDISLEAPSDQVVGTFVVIACYVSVVSSGAPPIPMYATDSQGNDYDLGYTNYGVVLAWSRLERQVDAGDFFTVSFDADIGGSIAGAAFTGMAGSAYDVRKIGHADNSTAPASGSFTTTGPGDLLVEVFTNIDSLAAHTLTLTDGATVAGSVDTGVGSLRLASRLAGAAGSYNATGTWSGSATEWTVLAVAFTPDTRSILHGDGSELADVTPPVLSLDVAWGARTPGGRLTDVEAGRATISILDVDRVYDPANLSAPVALNAGTFAQIKVDGSPAFSGYLDSVEHSLAEGVTTLVLGDAIPRLSKMGVVTTLTADFTTVQFAEVMAEVGFTGYAILGTSATPRVLQPIVLSAWAALQQIRDAEVGSLYVDRAGVVTFATYTYSAAPAARADIGDSPGIPLLDINTQLSRDPIVNHIAVDITDDTFPDLAYQDDASVAHYGRRSRGWTELDLGLPGFGFKAAWAAAILADLADGVRVTKLGSLIPEGAEVAELVCADYGDRFHVVDSYHGEPIDRYVQLLGAAWSVSYDGGWIVDLVTQDE